MHRVIAVLNSDKCLPKTMEKIVTLLLCLGVCATIEGVKLPSYIKRCSRSDPKINECVRDNANDCIPKIINGVKSLKIPKLEPMKIESVSIEASNSLKIDLKNIEVYGLSGAKVTNAFIDLPNDILKMDVFIPKIELSGKHEIHGRILLLVLDGTGPANITLNNGLYKFSTQLQQFERKGKNYATVKTHNIVFDAEESHYQLDNIFNGNKALSDQVNGLLNDKENEVYKELQPAVCEAISSVIASILDSVLNRVAFDDILLP